MKYTHKRYLKNYLIAPKEQILFGFFTLTLVIIAWGSHLLFVIKKIRYFRETGQMFENDIDAEIIFYILQSFGLIALILGVFIFILNIVFTHRVFGSLYNIEKHFRNAEIGKSIGLIPIRKYDMTNSLVEAINHYFEKTQQNKNEK